MSFETPILFLTYRRFSTAKKVFDEIKKIKPKKLYFASNIPEKINYNNDINKFHTNNIYFIKHLWSKTWSFDELPTNFKSNIDFINLLNNDSRNDNNKYYIELYDNVFLHYRGGSGWNNNLDSNFINNFKKSFDL